MKKRMALLLAGAVAGSMFLGGCGRINDDAVVATLNKDTEISLGYANFVARYQQASYDSWAISYYGDTFWTDDSFSEDGKTMEDSVKETVIEGIRLDYLLESHMADYGVEITDEEKAKITAAAEQFMSDNSKEAISQMGATQEYVEKMLYYRTLEHKMQEAIYDEVDTNVTDDEAAQKTYSYISVSLEGKYDDEGNYQEYTDEEAEEVKETAKKMAEEAKTDFDAAAEDYDYDVLTNSYGKDDVVDEDDEAYSPLIAAAEKLKEGEVSGLIENEDNYYIIRMDSLFDEEATEQEKENIINTRRIEHYTEVTDGYKEGDSFDLDEKLWEKVKFDDLFTAPPTDGEETDSDAGTVDVSAPEE